LKLISENLDNIDFGKTEISGSCGLNLMAFVRPCLCSLTSPSV